MNGRLSVVAAKQRHDIDESIEFGVRVSLNNRLKFAEQRFDRVTADRKAAFALSQGTKYEDVF